MSPGPTGRAGAGFHSFRGGVAHRNLLLQPDTAPQRLGARRHRHRKHFARGGDPDARNDVCHAARREEAHHGRSPRCIDGAGGVDGDQRHHPWFLPRRSLGDTGGAPVSHSPWEWAAALVLAAIVASAIMLLRQLFAVSMLTPSPRPKRAVRRKPLDARRGASVGCPPEWTNRSRRRSQLLH